MRPSRSQPWLRAGAWTGVCLLAVVAAAPAVRASECRADARERLTWIDQRLDLTATHARWWAWGWGVGIGASGVASLAAVPFVAPGERIDWYTSAGTAAIGVLPFLFSPLRAPADAPRLHAAVVALPPDDHAATCALLSAAEATLIENARNQRDQQRWYFHAGNVAFNTGVMLFLGLGFHHWTSGIINGAAGAVVGEAIIFTQPTGSVRDVEF